jgi:O-antigen ligase
VAIGLTAGLLTRSDSYLVCVLLALLVYLVVKARTWFGTLRHGPSLRGAAVVVVLLAIPLAAVAALPFLPATAALVEKKMTAVYEDHDQGDTRLALWGEAIDKGMESGLLGFGPGAHLTAKSFKRPPPDKFEAHNMVFELLTQGGVLAVAAYVWLCATTLLRTWRARLPMLAGLAVGFVGFGMFHLIIRHPLLWFVFTICLLEAWRAVPVPALRRMPAAWPASRSLATGQIK